MVAAAMTETLALRRPARARRRPGRERTMQFQAWRATTARRAIPGESGVREICMRRLEGRAEVAGQRWPAASPDPTPMKRGNARTLWREGGSKTTQCSEDTWQHAEAEEPCQRNSSAYPNWRSKIARCNSR